LHKPVLGTGSNRFSTIRFKPVCVYENRFAFNRLQPVAQTGLLLIKFNLSLRTNVFINDEFKTTKKNIVLLIKRPFIKPKPILLIKKNYL